MSFVPGIESEALDTVGKDRGREGETETLEILVVIAPAYQYSANISSLLHLDSNSIIFISWNMRDERSHFIMMRNHLAGLLCFESQCGSKGH